MTDSVLDNILERRAGDDSLCGGSGDDTLVGASSADQMDDGRGDDAHKIDEMGDRAIDAAGAGHDALLMLRLTWRRRFCLCLG